MDIDYDLELVIPICLKDKFLDRVASLRDFGFLNIKDRNILITILTGTEDVEIAKSILGDNLNIRYKPGTQDYVASKVNEYFGNLKAEDIRSRWIAKLDDDIANDIDGLISNLDAEFDCERDFYITTENRDDGIAVDVELLFRLGYESRWKYARLWHEWEGSVVSYPAIKRILSNPDSVCYLQERGKIPRGYCDIGLSFAARISKVYPIDAFFMTKLTDIANFSLFGGYLNHIHDLAPDKDRNAFTIFSNLLSGEYRNHPLFDKVVNTSLVIQYKRDIKIIHLNSNGMVSVKGQEPVRGREKRTMRLWTLDDNKLNICNTYGKTLHSLIIKDGSIVSDSDDVRKVSTDIEFL